MATVPAAAAVTDWTDMLPSSASVSLARTSMVTAVSSAVSTWSSPATGGWLLAATVTVVAAVSVAPSWSVTVSEIVCDPAVSNVKVGAAEVDVPAAPASHA